MNSDNNQSEKKELRNLRRKFCQDFDIPIAVMDDPYYTYFYELYRKELKLDELQRIFDQAIVKHPTSQSLRDSWFNLKDKITEDIKQTKAFEDFQKQEFKFSYEHTKDLEKGNLYNENGLKYSIVSVDIRKANYTALKTFSKELVLGTDSFEELILKYTDLEYYQKSKIFRQLLFEPLNGKKQSQIQKNILSEVYGELKGSVDCLKARAVGSDELYFVFDRDVDLESKEKQIIELISQSKHKDILKVEAFRIDHIVRDCFVKTTTKGEKSLKHVPQIFYAQVFKHFHGLALEKRDLYFVFEKSVACFNQSIFDKE